MHPWSTEVARTWLILAFLYVFGLSMLGVGPVGAAVLIAEVLPDPASDWDADGVVDTRGDEWVEVVNTGPDSVDLSAYWLRDALGDAAQLRLAGTLEPGGTALFTGSEALAWQAANGLSSTGLSLNNAGDELQLFLGDPLEPGAVLVDQMLYPAHVGVDDRSIARFLPDNVWVLCDALNPYGGELDPVGTDCPPTPGEVNACAHLVPAERAGWGQVKRLYHR